MGLSSKEKQEKLEVMKSELDNIKKEIKEIRKIVDDIKKLVMSPKYSGDIEWGDRYHASRLHKHINLNLRIDKEDEEM